MTVTVFLCALQLFKVASANGEALHPTYFMHGVNGHASDWDFMISVINTTNPGTWTHAFTEFSGEGKSWVALETQISDLQGVIREHIKENATLFSDGYNLVCHSQGGLLCRCLIEDMDDHNVRNLVSLAGPQEGVYGYAWLEGIGFFEKHPKLADWVMDDLSHYILYSEELQLISTGNMWHDPLHEEEYMEKNVFLPKLNGLVGNVTRYKDNFIRLHKASFMVGTFSDTEYDGGVEPFQSGVFGYYTNNSNTTYETIKERNLYKKDLFGLKTLDEDGRLNLVSKDGVKHNDWIYSRHIVQNYVLTALD